MDQHLIVIHYQDIEKSPFDKKGHSDDATDYNNRNDKNKIAHNMNIR